MGRASRASFTAGILLLVSSHEASWPPRSTGAPAPPPGRLGALADPSPLSTQEEGHPLALALARQFNPAMVLPWRDIWPVEVRYAWHDGADLVARVKTGGRVREHVAVPGRMLDRTDWSHLPSRTPEGHEVRYYVDAPGDDRPAGQEGLSRWRHRWRQIVQPNGLDASPSQSAYPPTQYAHLFWWNRAKGLLAIQYWFYYPFNEWANRHEGDWEHIQVVLEGPSTFEDGATFKPVGHQFFFHEFWVEPEEMVRLPGEDPAEDHPLVFVGGQGRFLFWGGDFSGGSFPLPGRYEKSGFRSKWLAPADEVVQQERFLAAGDFNVILLPEPERLDGRRHPELSWLRLPFYPGQASVFTNPPLYGLLGGDHPPSNPARRPEWSAPPASAPWAGRLVPMAEVLAEKSAGDRRLAGAAPGTWTAALVGLSEVLPAAKPQ